MKKIGVKIGALLGGSADQERALRSWMRGSISRAILAPPGVLGVDIHATTIIFLTDLISDQEYRQALARVVRQGNPAVEQNIPIKVRILVCKDTEEMDELTISTKRKITEERVHPATTFSTSCNRQGSSGTSSELPGQVSVD